MNKATNKKAINGVFLLNKPEGLSSNTCLQKVKRHFSAMKAGHMGTLDPLATGMLPICLGEATKFSQYGLEADKAYRVRGMLGVKTDTADALGQIIAVNNNFCLQRKDLEALLPEFTGAIQQVPSMFSALKHQGKPLYALARAGISIDRPARGIHIYSIEILDFEPPYFSLEVICSKGTYIRNLVEDIGERLGPAAHVTELQRLYTAGFKPYPMCSLDDLAALSEEESLAKLLPVDVAIQNFEILQLESQEVVALQRGQVLSQAAGQCPAGLYRAYESGQFKGLVERCDLGQIKAKRMLSTAQTK